MCQSGQDTKRNTGVQVEERSKNRVITKVVLIHLFLNLFQGVVTNFEIFRMREKQVPVDVVEMKGKN